MKQRSEEVGSIVEWLIFAIVIVGVSMLIAWRYIEADREQNETQRALTETLILKKKTD